MIADLKPYPTMKDSGVEWLGEVPEHWEVRQLGRIGRFAKGKGGTKEDEVADGVPCVRYGDLYTQHRFFVLNSRACVTKEKAADYTPILYGDILFAGSGETIEEIGKSAVNLIAGPACCGGDVILFRPSIEVDANFFGYATDCPQAAYQKSCMGRGITIMHIYGDELKYMYVGLPPHPEQDAIVRYLDYINRRVRRLVRAKQKLIALLEEQKQAIIHRAVTRGLDPDVPLKDSGVEYLGEVPEHWEVRRLFQICGVIDPHPSHRNPPPIRDGIPFLGVGDLDVDGNVVNVSHRVGRDILADQNARVLIEDGDLAIGRVASVGKVVRLRPGEICLSGRLAVLKPLIDSDFLFCCLGSSSTQHQITVGTDRTTMGVLGLNKLKRIYLCVPPLHEQRLLVKHINELTGGIDSALSRANREIELLREYRARLIADVVTGKLDVREAAAKLPEETDKVEPLNEAEDLMDEGDAMAADSGTGPEEAANVAE